MLCQYRDILGKINKGVHSYRIFDIAIIDVIMTFILAKFINMFIPKYNYFIILILLFILAIFLHYIFCVKTTINKLLFY